MKPSNLIALAVKREREQAGLSLSALATKASLSKSTLSQIETGQGNPGIETLWAIASALEIPFSFLFENAAPQSQLIRVGDGEFLSSDASEFFTTLLSKCPPMRRRDLYRVTIQKGERRDADPHPIGTIEHAFVCNGSVDLGPSGDVQTLSGGDYFRYPADVPHSYSAVSAVTTFFLVMEN